MKNLDISNSYKEFDKLVNIYTLKFNDPNLEQKYNKSKFTPLNTLKSLRISFIILLVMLVLREIELLIFSIKEIPSILKSDTIIWISISHMFTTILIEFFIRRLDIFKSLQGFFGLVYIFTMSSYISYSSSNDEPYVIHR